MSTFVHFLKYVSDNNELSIKELEIEKQEGESFKQFLMRFNFVWTWLEKKGLSRSCVKFQLPDNDLDKYRFNQGAVKWTSLLTKPEKWSTFAQLSALDFPQYSEIHAEEILTRVEIFIEELKFDFPPEEFLSK